jgi:acid phosphatase (class A)
MRTLFLTLALTLAGCASAPTKPAAVAPAPVVLPFGGPPPAGDALLALDKSTSRIVFSPERRAQAKADDALDPFKAFAPQMEGDFSAAKRPALAQAFAAVRPALSPMIGTGKDKWKRPRPFLADSEIKPCIDDVSPLVASGAYPSGHAALGYGWALVLAEIAPPAKHDAILARGRDYGFSRAVCGLHWLSDIEAGRLIAVDGIAAAKRDPAFVALLAAAKAEQAALTAPAAPAAR